MHPNLALSRSRHPVRKAQKRFKASARIDYVEKILHERVLMTRYSMPRLARYRLMVLYSFLLVTRRVSKVTFIEYTPPKPVLPITADESHVSIPLGLPRNSSTKLEDLTHMARRATFGRYES